MRTKSSSQDVIVEITKVTHYLHRVYIVTTRCFDFRKKHCKELEILLTSKRHFFVMARPNIFVLGDSVALASFSELLEERSFYTHEFGMILDSNRHAPREGTRNRMDSMCFWVAKCFYFTSRRLEMLLASSFELCDMSFICISILCTMYCTVYR